jgi:hypothetical protein
MEKVRQAWLVVLLGLGIVLGASLVYTAYPVTSSICSFFGYQGTCPIGTFTQGGVYLDHEYLGLGMAFAALFSRNERFRLVFFLLGLALVATDLGDTFTQTLTGIASSTGIGFLFVFSFDRAFFTDDDSLEVHSVEL